MLLGSIAKFTRPPPPPPQIAKQILQLQYLMEVVPSGKCFNY